MIEFNEHEIKATAYKANLQNPDEFTAGARHQYQLDLWEYRKLLDKYEKTVAELKVYKTGLLDMIKAREALRK